MDSAAIRTEGLRRTYRISKRERKRQGGDPSVELLALDDVSLTIRPGELFGVLGPNGAGKTTLIKILTTLLAPTAGQAWVLGLDVVTHAHSLRPLINMVSGGESCGYGLLTVRETLWLFAQIYGVPTAQAHRRIDAMLEVVGLTDKAHTKVSHLSTGMRQKMNFCRGFVTDPQVLFLDEPTLGLDVNAARSIRRFVRRWIGERPNRVILLTTHYMMEADELCDRVAIIDNGKVMACDAPAMLKRRAQAYPLFQITVEPGESSWTSLRDIRGVHSLVEEAGPTTIDLKVALQDDQAIAAVVQRIIANGGRIVTLRKVEPTLEDVFVDLVGHGLQDADAAPAR